MIQIAPNSFFQAFDPTNPAPKAATPEIAQEMLTKFLADLADDKFDQTDDSFDGYQRLLERIIRVGGIHPALPPYPKFKNLEQP